MKLSDFPTRQKNVMEAASRCQYAKDTCIPDDVLINRNDIQMLIDRVRVFDEWLALISKLED